MYYYNTFTKIKHKKSPKQKCDQLINTKYCQLPGN
jgi:hypothetical protein